ncbi:MAG: hypothetical protein CM15mV117_240 [Caudoviricetes sp.]|nr:MAG: hypothetical protein CM15mV117_240 [Caudoviricetes sp.]
MGTGSGVVTTTEVSPELSLPPSSLNLRIYSPSTAGTNVSDTFPGKAGIISTELVNVPVPSVRLLCRTTTFPPCVTSISVALSKRSRTN